MHNVLDKGFTRLVESMGDDSSIVQAARVSYGDGSKGEEKDRKLIRYLLEHDHGTPFEMVSFKFHIKAPIFVARQWFRHRIGSFNEISGRYTEMKDEFYIPETFRAQDTKNKQGSNEVLDYFKDEVRRDKIENHCMDSMSLYRELMIDGMAREMARMVLPLNTYTEFYWSVNARSLMNFIRLRIAPGAQWEIQQYAQALIKDMKNVIPWATEDFRATL